MMSDLLMQAFDRARQRVPDQLTNAMDALPAVGELPSPWATWTLIELVRYRRRQLWARQAIRESDPWRDGAIESLRDGGNIPEEDAHGFPGRARPRPPGGRPSFCHVINRATGEEVIVDLASVGGGEILLDISHILGHWEHQRWGGSTARMHQLHPFIKSVLYARSELLDLGYLEEVCLDEDTGCIAERLTPVVRGNVRAIEDFLQAWSASANRLWLSALIGDWPAAACAAEESSNPEWIALTASRADRCRALRLAHIRSGEVYYPGEHAFPEIFLKGMASSEQARGCPPFLGALRQVDAAEFDIHMRRALKGDSWESRWAVRFLELLHDPSLCELVDQFFRRAMASGSEDDLGLALHCADYLTRHGYRTEATIASMRDVDLLLDEAAILAMEYAPGLVPEIVRSGLRSTADGVPMRIAAALALIDRPWSRRELISAFEESETPDQALWCRMALHESGDPEARRTAEEWEATHLGGTSGDPRDDEEGSDHLPDPAELFQYEVERLRDRVGPLRARNPG